MASENAHTIPVFTIIIFLRIQQAEAEYKKAFSDELEGFKDRVRKRAEQKLEQLMKEAEEEERQARLGPGGLDPIEVMEALPEVSPLH